jgi:hypothetical protein
MVVWIEHLHFVVEVAPNIVEPLLQSWDVVDNLRSVLVVAIRLGKMIDSLTYWSLTLAHLCHIGAYSII